MVRPARFQPLRAPHGFTLVEVLVAMLILSIVALMSWQGVDGIVRAREASQSRLEQTLRLNTALTQWELDLASLQETPSVPALVFDGATLRLTRRAERGMQVVAWSLRPDAPSGYQWLRWASPPVTGSADLQEQWMRSAQLQGAEPGQLQVLSGLLQWQLYYYRGNAWTNAQSSGDTASPPPTVVGTAAGSASAPGSATGTAAPVDSAAAPRALLPNGVRLALAFAPSSGYNGTLVRDVALGPQP